MTKLKPPRVSSTLALGSLTSTAHCTSDDTTSMADYESAGANGEEHYMESTETSQQVGYEQDSSSANPGDMSKNGAEDRRGGLQMQSNDKNEWKIFVGGLSWQTTVKDLQEYFEKYGSVVDCTLKTDHATGRSRGFGFVLFGEAESVDKVLAESSHVLHGRTIDPKRAKARGGREPIVKVFVGGVDPNVPESEIREHFEHYGKVVDLVLPFDKLKDQRRAFCFVTFETEEIVDKVCEQPKQDIGGKTVDVKKATPKSEQGGGFGGGYGGRGRGGFDGGRGRGRGGYDQSGWGGGQGYNNGGGYGGGYDSYSGYGGYGGYGGYDYSAGNYDYSDYYNQGWGSQPGYEGYGGGYGGGYGDATAVQDQGQGGYESKRGAGRGYHPYSR